jgi:hypothetical protein
MDSALVGGRHTNIGIVAGDAMDSRRAGADIMNIAPTLP